MRTQISTNHHIFVLEAVDTRESKQLKKRASA